MEKKDLNLKLIGRSAEDLKTISTYLQDSIVMVKDIVFLKENKIFVMIVSRFMWEDIERGLFRKNKRVRSVIRFNRAQKVLSYNINQKRGDKLLEFLAIKESLKTDKTHEIRFVFSGDSMISILVEEIDCLLDDQGKPWTVKKVPMHKI